MTDTYTWSPSQIDSFDQCQRKWAFRSIAKIKTDQHPSAQLGTETHRQLETYLAGGELDFTLPSGNIAATGLKHLPQPLTPGLVLEGHFKFQSPDSGFWYQGYRDFYIPSPPRERPLIGDHKTTGNLRYAKTPEDLETDRQAIIYARNENTDQDVDLLWVYYTTKGTLKSHPVSVTLPRSHVLLQFANLELTAEKMRVIVDESKSAQEDLTAFVKTLPPSPQSCEMYGGCPYRHLCQLGPEDRLSSLFGKNLTIMENQMTQGVSALIARIQAAQAKPSAPETFVPPEAPALVVDHGPSKGQDVFTQDFINPPPMPAVLDPVLSSGEDVHTAPTTPPPPPPEPAKRHRRTKAEMEAARAAEFTTAKEKVFTEHAETFQKLADTPAPFDLKSLQMPEDMCKPKASAVVMDGYVLYVDCLPSTLAEDISHTLNVAKRAVCEKTGKPDYRLADYGQGPGLLAVALEDMINGGHLTGDLFISTQCQETHAVLEVLTRRATRVVRAVR